MPQPARIKVHQLHLRSLNHTEFMACRRAWKQVLDDARRRKPTGAPDGEGPR